MVKKIVSMFFCDLALALIMFAKVSVKNFLLKNLTEDAASEQAAALLSGNNWITIFAMILVAVVICMLTATKTEAFNQMIVDIILLGVPGLVLMIWWNILELTNWGYFCSYQEMMAYIGALMVGSYIYKTIKYVFNKNNGGNG